MSLPQWLVSLGAWSAQVAALVAVAAVAAAGLRLTLPRARRALWQALPARGPVPPLVPPAPPAPAGRPRGAAPRDPVPASIDRAIGLSGASATFALSAAVDGPVTFGLRRP